VAFIKFLTIYQIYHNQIHPLHFILLPPTPGIVSTGIHNLYNKMILFVLSLSYLEYDTFSQSFFDFLTLILLKITDQLFCRISLSLGLSDFSS
jgi:hypothetical protein